MYIFSFQTGKAKPIQTFPLQSSGQSLPFVYPGALIWLQPSAPDTAELCKSSATLAKTLKQSKFSSSAPDQNIAPFRVKSSVTEPGAQFLTQHATHIQIPDLHEH